VSAAPDRIARLLALVPWLRAHDGVTIEEAAAHFGLSAEQLEKDLWLLVVCGIPGYGPDQLIDIDFWDGGHIHVRDPQTLGSPMRLSHEEATALLVALGVLAQLPGSSTAVTTALAKLQNATIDQNEIAVHIATQPNPEVLQALQLAVQESRSVNISYAAGTTGEITDRRIEPLQIVSVDGRDLVLAYCWRAEANRTFRIDRILNAEPAGSAEHGLLGQTALVESVPAYVAVCDLAPAARWVADVHPILERTEGVDGHLSIRIPVHQEAWLVSLVLSLRGAMVVREPRELRHAVAAAADRTLTTYAKRSQ
jgi:predicted DNA-binding transcriptional regulator YafY